MRISIRDIRQSLPELDVLVAKEREIVLTRRGLPIARILPMEGTRRMPSRAALRAKTKRSTTSSATLIRNERNER